MAPDFAQAAAEIAVATRHTGASAGRNKAGTIKVIARLSSRLNDLAPVLVAMARARPVLTSSHEPAHDRVPGAVAEKAAGGQGKARLAPDLVARARTRRADGAHDNPCDSLWGDAAVALPAGEAEHVGGDLGVAAVRQPLGDKALQGVGKGGRIRNAVPGSFSHP
jgi:hypothetical protein